MNTCMTNRREQIIEQILIVECSQRFSQHVKYTLERFKRPSAVKKIDYSAPQDESDPVEQIRALRGESGHRMIRAPGDGLGHRGSKPGWNNRNSHESLRKGT